MKKRYLTRCTFILRFHNFQRLTLLESGTVWSFVRTIACGVSSQLAPTGRRLCFSSLLACE